MRTSFHRVVISCLLAMVLETGLSAGAADSIDALRTEAFSREGEALAALKELCAVAPQRLAGSADLERALAWAEARLASLPGATVRRQEVLVPHWKRGRQAEARLLSGTDREPLALLALGYSGATPAEGLEAGVVEVPSLQALEALGSERVRGKIVFFNRPMQLDSAGKGSGYGGAVDQRSRGPALAARLGAVAALVRSITNADDDLPHTGMTRFASGLTPLPSAALGVRSADRLSSALRAQPDARLHLIIDGRLETAPARTANLVAEVRGRELPDRILLVGGHLDAWDVAPGAHDNAAGVVQSMEVFRLLARAPGPRHTLRCVLFTSEEIGALGGLEYGSRAAAAAERHVLAVETDAGGFAPTGFDFGPKPDPSVAERVRAAWAGRLTPLGIVSYTALHGGTDVGPLQAQGAVTAYLRTDSVRYFRLHHAPSDTPDRVDARELQAGTAAIATLLALADGAGMP